MSSMCTLTKPSVYVLSQSSLILLSHVCVSVHIPPASIYDCGGCYLCLSVVMSNKYKTWQLYRSMCLDHSRGT